MKISKLSGRGQLKIGKRIHFSVAFKQQKVKEIVNEETTKSIAYSPDIQLFPNPATHTIHLNTELSDYTQADVFLYAPIEELAGGGKVCDC